MLKKKVLFNSFLQNPDQNLQHMLKAKFGFFIVMDLVTLDEGSYVHRGEKKDQVESIHWCHLDFSQFSTFLYIISFYLNQSLST